MRSIRFNAPRCPDSSVGRAGDLKSLGLWLYEFKSRPGYHLNKINKNNKLYYNLMPPCAVFFRLEIDKWQQGV